AFGGFHHVAAAPEVVEGVVHAHLADAVAVGEFDAAFDRAVGDALAELAVGVPDFRSGEAGAHHLDFRAGGAAAGGAAGEVVGVGGLERVGGADAVARGFGGEPGAFAGFVGGVAARAVGGFDQAVVGFAGDREKVGHALEWAGGPR